MFKLLENINGEMIRNVMVMIISPLDNQSPIDAKAHLHRQSHKSQC